MPKKVIYPRFINISPLKEIHAKLLFKKIAEIVQNLHNNGVYHRDIKTENILLDEKFNLFISDFGFSTTEKVSSKKVGTYCYAAPEIFISACNCQKVDIFALGVTLFNLVTSTYGFDEAQSSDTFYKLIAIRKYPEYWEKTSSIIKNTISEEFKNLYLKMVAYRVSERPSIKEILEDEWMKEINEKNEKEIKELESEIYKEFCDREEIIKNLTEKNVTKPNNDKYDNNIKGENRNTSEGGKDDFEEILPKTFRKGKYLENFNVINGDLDPVIFMNDLTKNLRKGNNMKEKDYDCKSIVASKYKLKFRATFEKVTNVESDEEIDEDIKKEFEKLKLEEEKEEEKEDENGEENEEEDEENEDEIIKKKCSIIIELYKYGDKKHLLRYVRKSGTLDDFYKILKFINNCIDKIIN